LSDPSIFWHDYETWGANPTKDPAVQFAGIRTDLELNIIGKPVNFYCQIPSDYLPQPQASLITGITPQQSLRDGMIEAEFASKIHEIFSVPATCAAGYNSIRFDDEVTRNLFYRNFYDPYAREWQQANSRWDIIDMVRACYALRPEGINWPTTEDGVPSFRLERLSEANAISHQDAHDAMSDVYATIGLAKLIRDKHPRLYDYLFNLRLKKEVSKLIDWQHKTPLVHISSKLPALNGCCTWVVPVCPHPGNKNAIIALNLALDPQPLFDLPAEVLREKLYTPQALLEEDEQRLPIKLIHINKCPVIAPAKTLTQENAQRLGIDRTVCLNNLEKIKACQGLEQKLQDIFDTPRDDQQRDADHALYSGGFLSDADKSKAEQLHHCHPEQLASLNWKFDDNRLNTLLFRYRARNYPATLNASELEQWQRHRQFRLLDPDSPGSITMQEYLQEIERLTELNAQDANKLAILRALYQYAQSI
jgi:exodeoxyribonuclease I